MFKKNFKTAIKSLIAIAAVSVTSVSCNTTTMPGESSAHASQGPQIPLLDVNTSDPNAAPVVLEAKVGTDVIFHEKHSSNEKWAKVEIRNMQLWVYTDRLDCINPSKETTCQLKLN
ncbi:hypothetical protein IQ260_18725 [Leptolyngbya cf. ectocarpi LEGE 11479]|uniref:SH3 domain-containing protein n=1 Tax=Leptolyngbya cf. ectocarpi LEGE 11479 TaxID=1828722 RepID=A0A928ZWE9_LEPEC|nr:hypothetical protein [Leptolyngbya ectocarpi]MBE9068684.1 hypothetical protein [Leptolyngbya cf. ectocarpi LEGE 11479]